MTRQDILKTFPNATEDQISAIMASHHAELNQEKEKNKDLKDTSKELEAAQKELEELRAKAESGAPKDWQEQLDKLTEAYNKSQKTIKNMQLKNSLKENSRKVHKNNGRGWRYCICTRRVKDKCNC